MPFQITPSDPTLFTKTLPTKIFYHQENRVWRIAKDVLSVLFLPVGLYRAWHRVVGFAVVPASMRELLSKFGFYPATSPTILEKSLNKLRDLGWTLQRLTIEADGQQIDATLLIKPSKDPLNTKNDRWTLYSTGNMQQYEDVLSDADYCNNLFGAGNLDTNVLFFNYPGVGKSEGFPSRSGSVKAYQTLLRWLEKEGEAKELIGFGHSIGGGIQGEAIANHPKKTDVFYCFIKDRTFSHLSGVAEDITKIRMPKLGKVLGPIVKKIVELSSWNIQTAKASLRTTHPEIIIQTWDQAPQEASWDEHTHKVVNDEIIDSGRSLALELANKKHLKETELIAKRLLLVQESHNLPLGSNPDSIHILCKTVNKNLAKQKKPEAL